jgi:putative Mg2+ transporter-C (MgtC) family protein
MGSLLISYQQGRQEWRFVAVALSKERGTNLTEMAELFVALDGVGEFNLTHARN